MKTYIVSAIIVLSLINLNSPQPILEPHRVANSDNVVVSFVRRNYTQEAFPDRTSQVAEAKQLDAIRRNEEQARLQAIEAQRIAEANKVPVVTQNTPTVAPLSLQEGMLKLRQCESGGNYAINTGNGYYGAYQYDLQTWGNFMGFARPDLAPPDVQDAKFLETYNRRGKSPWPSCGRYLP